MTDALTGNQVPAKSGGAGTLKKSFPGLSFLDNLSEMTVLRQTGPLVGLATSVAIGFAVMLWSQQSGCKPLYDNLNGVDANRVVGALAAADIPHRIKPNSGALLVKTDDLGRVRMKVAFADTAPTDNSIGSGILDKERALGTSQFMEATNYRRGLEGELAHTASSLDNVRAARVHLAIPKSSVFAHDDRKPSVSVLIELYPGRSLGLSQVMAIVNLVTTSAPELNESQVTVVDQKGNLLSDQQELSELTMTGKQFGFTRRMEGLLTQRAHNILQLVLGNGRYKVEVSADVGFSAVESTSEMYDPDQPTLRGEQRNNEERQNSSGSQGVPRVLSSQPPDPASAPRQATASTPADYVAPGQPLKGANSQTIIDPRTGKPELMPYPTDKRDQTTRSYELDRSISYAKQRRGHLRRLSVAVALGNRMKVDAKIGEVSHQPWNADGLARFTRLIQDSVGYDASRGDSVSVVSALFAPTQAKEVDNIPFYSQPWFWDIVKQMLGVLLILVLTFGALRPVLSNITGGDKGKSLAGDGSRNGDLALDKNDLGGSLADDRVSVGGPSSILLPSPTEGYDAQLNAIKNLVAQDPGRVAQIVKEWINADE